MAQTIQKGPDGQMIKKSIVLTPTQVVIINFNLKAKHSSSCFDLFLAKSQVIHANDRTKDTNTTSSGEYNKSNR